MDNDYTVDKLHDAKSVTLSDDRILNNHNVAGHVTGQPEYKFEAKVFDVGSERGIDGGRISGLRVTKGDAFVLEYSRGWAKGQDPSHHTAEQKTVLSKIKAGFPETQYLKDKAAKENEAARSKLKPSLQQINDRSVARDSASVDKSAERNGQGR